MKAGSRGNLFAVFRRVVTKGSRGLGKRVVRQDEGSSTELKNLRDSFSRRSARVGIAVQYKTLM